jgi:hypothetical protein
MACLAIAVTALAWVRGPTCAEWMSIGVWFLLANGAEYVMHRWPMHHRYPGLRAIVRRHAGVHHRFFTHDAMAGQFSGDYHATLFAPRLIVVVVSLVIVPLTVLITLLLSQNAACFFVATSVLYFLLYEWLHLACHVYEDAPLARLPGLAALRQSHQLHHDPGLMGQWNFNITFPVFDLLQGTHWRGDEPEPVIDSAVTDAVGA